MPRRILVALVLALALVAAAGAATAPRPIPGLAPSDVWLQLDHIGFDCAGPARGRGRLTWRCTRTIGTATFTVTIYGTSAAQLLAMRGRAVVRSGDVDALARPVLAYLATFHYRGARPLEARRWVASLLGRRASRSFGGVRYTLGAAARTRSLQIGSLA